MVRSQREKCLFQGTQSSNKMRDDKIKEAAGGEMTIINRRGY